MERLERPYDLEITLEEENKDVTLYTPIKDVQGNEVGNFIAIIREDLTSEFYMRFFEGATVQTNDVTPQLESFLADFIGVFKSETH